MFLDRRQIELVKKAIDDYNFIKEEIELRISKDYNLEEISQVLVKFKGITIENLEDYENEAYLDFEYNNINTWVSWQRNTGTCVSSTFEIYDDKEMCYIVEDFLSIKEYEEMINTPKETMLANAVAELKCYESNNYKDSYNRQRDKIISFLKEEY